MNEKKGLSKDKEIFLFLETICKESWEKMGKELGLFDKPRACTDTRGFPICALTLTSKSGMMNDVYKIGECPYRGKQEKYHVVPSVNDEVLELYYYECEYQKDKEV